GAYLGATAAASTSHARPSGAPLTSWTAPTAASSTGAATSSPPVHGTTSRKSRSRQVAGSLSSHVSRSAVPCITGPHRPGPGSPARSAGGVGGGRYGSAIATPAHARTSRRLTRAAARASRTAGGKRKTRPAKKLSSTATSITTATSSPSTARENRP